MSSDGLPLLAGAACPPQLPLGTRGATRHPYSAKAASNPTTGFGRNAPTMQGALYDTPPFLSRMKGKTTRRCISKQCTSGNRLRSLARHVRLRANQHIAIASAYCYEPYQWYVFCASHKKPKLGATCTLYLSRRRAPGLIRARRMSCHLGDSRTGCCGSSECDRSV